MGDMKSSTLTQCIALQRWSNLTCWQCWRMRRAECTTIQHNTLQFWRMQSQCGQCRWAQYNPTLQGVEVLQKLIALQSNNAFQFLRMRCNEGTECNITMQPYKVLKFRKTWMHCTIWGSVFLHCFEVCNLLQRKKSAELRLFIQSITFYMQSIQQLTHKILQYLLARQITRTSIISSLLLSFGRSTCQCKRKGENVSLFALNRNLISRQYTNKSEVWSYL